MELREVRRLKRRLHLLALFTLCTAFGLLFFGSVGILMASDIMAVNRVGEDKNIDSFCEISDEEVPLITLKGDKRVSFKVNTEYNDPGTVVEDDCDNVTVESSTDLDITKTGDYVITYKSTDNSGNYAEVHRYLKVVPEVGTIYLTFDDGPGPYTAELLDILKKYNVKATFFVTRAGEDSILLREYEEGHSIGLHTYSHQYSYIYQNTDNFLNDLIAVQDRVKNITGYTSYLMRFPGGSSNTISAKYDGGTHIISTLAPELEKRGFVYFDWNVSSGDAEGLADSDAVYNRTITSLKPGDNVVLQHDVKKYSVDAVERIIQYGLSNGYNFSALDKNSFTAHHAINN